MPAKETAMNASQDEIDHKYIRELEAENDKLKEAWDALPRSEAVDQLIASRAEVKQLKAHVDELMEKVSLDDCACSYDEPGDVCSKHSPIVERLKQQLADLQEHGKARDATYEILSKALDSYKAKLAALREEKSKSDAMCEQMRGELATLRAEVKRLAGENLNLANILASEKCPRCAAHAEDDRKREELEHDRQT